jgi:hypothetical protein
MAQLQEQLQAVSQGHLPPEEPLPVELATAPLLMGADGVMVPFRPEGGHPKGKTTGHEVKVGVLARLGRHRTRTGKVVARLHQRRLVAVFGDIEALQGCLWLAARRQGIWRAPQVGWRSDGAQGLWRLFEECFTAYATGLLDFYHAVQHLWKGAAAWGWTAAPAMRVGGSFGHGTASGMVSRMGSWPPWPRPWS